MIKISAAQILCRNYILISITKHLITIKGNKSMIIYS
jgi:hypothetical protein